MQFSIYTSIYAIYTIYKMGVMGVKISHFALWHCLFFFLFHWPVWTDADRPDEWPAGVVDGVEVVPGTVGGRRQRVAKATGRGGIGRGGEGRGDISEREKKKTGLHYLSVYILEEEKEKVKDEEKGKE